MSVEYRVVQRDGCTLIFGALPVSAFVMFARDAAPGTVVDADLARMAEASFAFGAREACAALKTQLAPAAAARVQAAHPQMAPDAVKWLAGGERGASSNAMFARLVGVETGYTTDHPSDLDDLRRCRLLLDHVPSLQSGFKDAMRDVSPQWTALVNAWDELCACMDREAPEWRTRGGSARDTAKRMADVLKVVAQ